jgi:hypothetical protein
MKVLVAGVVLLVLVASALGDVRPSPFQENPHPIQKNAHPPKEDADVQYHSSCLVQFISCLINSRPRVTGGRSINY